ncbi:Sugar transferase involved in LPS biosynthesis (colanic, teichoic acid) [Desulfurobacterium pacificum]|uniref:Sugar transferase involved in LPS biosynthesis (Colanic, teichoic acid) n=1 Tax=Desulfurobacterium pacificum TaxID=240166 RepID=A0ABY1NMZ1_9BACT|nr:sugar transferase [Desulfurobacterium pacificum]SMP14005.1 Sugar transferase involved in LPS biosynthesis (colanic, teichoic acid) [Desulfurobacterium pacificum]
MLYEKYFKRAFDFIASLCGLIILFPMFIVIAVLIKIEDGGRVFFRQTRVGQNGKLFKIYKFRTMVENAEKMGAQVTKGDDPRITKIGKILRKYKLDEFPQLINVVKGEMSLVGPRPEVPKYVKFFEEDYKEILRVKPGITDYASLEYKDENELLRGVDDPERVYLEKILPEKIKYYKRYLKEISFLTDLKLILKTIMEIFK